MLCVRLYRNKYTSKIDYYKIVDSNTANSDVFSTSSVKSILRSNPNAIDNLTLNKNGQIIYKDILPSRKVKCYVGSQYLDTSYIIQHLAFITGFDEKSGKVSVLVDTTIPTDKQSYVTFNASLTELERYFKQEAKAISFFNGALVQSQNNNIEINVINNNIVSCIGQIQTYSENKKELRGWSYSLPEVSLTGLKVESIWHKTGANKACLPDSIYEFDRFLGGVNNLIINDRITAIKPNCFYELEDLHSVQLGKNIREIGAEAFANSSLKDIKFSGSEQRILERAFNDCDQLKCAIVTKAVTIGVEAFSGTPITRLRLLNCFKIDTKAFEYCDKLESIQFSSCLDTIGAGAFQGCTRIKEIIIPNSCNYIGFRAFSGCKHLRSVKLPRHTRVESEAFDRNTIIEVY